MDWSLSAVESNITCDEAPCEVGPGFLATHAIHLPSRQVLLWDGLSDEMPRRANQYLWSIDTGTFEYVPAIYDRKGCAFNKLVDCVVDNDCANYCNVWTNFSCPIDFSCNSMGKCALNGSIDCIQRSDCVAYCQGLGLEEPECQYDSKDITCELAVAAPDLFCAGHVHGADGRPILAGGNILGNWGGGGLLSLVRFDPTDKAWSYLASTGTHRWYPSLVYTSDDRVFFMGGDLLKNTIQIFDPASNLVSTYDLQWLADVFADTKQRVQYPFLFTLDHGIIFYAGAEGFTTTYHNGHFFQSPGFDVPVQWLGATVTSQIPGGSAVYYDTRKIMKSGGCSSFGSRCPATEKAEVVDLNSISLDGENLFAPSYWNATCPMHHPRHFHTLTILPDGTVLATGGNREGNASFNKYCASGISPFGCSDSADCGISRCDNDAGMGSSGYATCTSPSDCGGDDCIVPGGTCDTYDNEHFATKSAELWDPATGRWTELAAQQNPRMYHSVALLLPDGRVLSAGGGKSGPLINQYSAEFFSPPYLFKGPRPVITEAPEEIGHGVMFEVELDPASVAATGISRFTLVRLASVTHGFDMEQRFVELDFQAIGPPARYRIFSPATPGVALPGWYLLFALNSDGVPSVGYYIRILQP